MVTSDSESEAVELLPAVSASALCTGAGAHRISSGGDSHQSLNFSRMHVMDVRCVSYDAFLCDPHRKALGQVEETVKKHKGRRDCKRKVHPRAPYSPTVHMVNRFGVKSQCFIDISPFDMKRKHLYKSVSLPASLNSDAVIVEVDLEQDIGSVPKDDCTSYCVAILPYVPLHPKIGTDSLVVASSENSGSALPPRA